VDKNGVLYIADSLNNRVLKTTAEWDCTARSADSPPDNVRFLSLLRRLILMQIHVVRPGARVLFIAAVLRAQ